MLFSILICLLIIISVSALCMLVFTPDSVKCEELFSQEEKDFIPYVRSPAGKDTGFVAVVRCSPDRVFKSKQLEYAGMTDCRIFQNAYGSGNLCNHGCTGYGTCVSFCPQEAIIIKNHTAIVTEACNGCGKCIEHCPQNLIELVPITQKYYKQCAVCSADAVNSCSVYCNNCGKCGNEADFTKDSVKRCAKKCIKKVSYPALKDFKFWKFCYNMFFRKNNNGSM